MLDEVRPWVVCRAAGGCTAPLLDKVQPWVKSDGIASSANATAGPLDDPVLPWTSSAGGDECALGLTSRVVAKGSVSRDTARAVASKVIVQRSFVKKVVEHHRAARRAARLAKEREAWAAELRQHLPNCQVILQFGADSPHVEAAFLRGSFGTLHRHWAGWNRFKLYCSFVAVEVADANECILADFASIFDEANADVEKLKDIYGRGAPSLRSSLAALDFVQRRAGLPAWTVALKSPVLLGYAAGAVLTAPKVSAVALPLCGVVGFELALRNEWYPLGLRLAAGWLLMCIWGSLRFCDGITVLPASLSLKDGVLYGYCRSAKGNVRGMAVACLASGLVRGTGRPWGAIFIELVHSWLQEAGVVDIKAIDFCLPAMCPTGATLQGHEAENWHVASVLRYLLSIAGVHDAYNFCVHGIKATLLAWSGQVSAVSKDARRRQGHHKGDVVELYSGDDSLEGLRTQLSVIRALEEGWRPSRPLQRGAAPPLSEPALQVDIPTSGLWEQFSHLLPWNEQKGGRRVPPPPPPLAPTGAYVGIPMRIVSFFKCVFRSGTASPGRGVCGYRWQRPGFLLTLRYVLVFIC